MYNNQNTSQHYTNNKTQEQKAVRNRTTCLVQSQNINHELRNVSIRNIRYALNYLPRIMLVSFLISVSFSEVAVFPRYFAMHFELVPLLEINMNNISEIKKWMMVGIIAFFVINLCILPIRGYITSIFVHIHPKWTMNNIYIEYSLPAYLSLSMVYILFNVLISVADTASMIKKVVGPDVSAEILEKANDIILQYVDDKIFVNTFIVNCIIMSLMLLLGNNKANRLYSEWSKNSYIR